MFNLALLLTSCADRNLRRPDEAVRWAEKACQMVKQPDANQLMILAIAYAQAGQSDMALETTEKAIREAEARGDTDLAELLRGRLRLYRDEVSTESVDE
jgi:Flp pilus assembly protein TadD